MPDTKVSALTDGVTANSTDRIPVARDAGGGTFNNRYVTPGYIGTTLLGSTTLNGATVAGTALSTVAITGTGGQFSCAAATLAVGQNVTISGTLGGTGSITGYSSPTTYTISATNGSTTFTLVNASTGAALTTTTGTPTGLTYVVTSPVVNFTQTWNNSNVTFTGLKFNATDTASASGSLLLDLQVGGTSKVSVSKNAQITAANTGGVTLRLDNVTANYWDIFSNSFLRFSRGPTGYFYIDPNGNVTIADTRSFAFGSADNGIGQTFLRGPAAATLQLGAADAAAPVAQTFKVQSGTAGASALSCSISGTTLTVGGAVTGTIAIGHAVTGTGVSAGTVITAGSGASWTVNNSQTVSSTTMYFNSVGANFTIRGSQGSGPSAGGSIIFQVAPAGSAATTAQNAYSTALTIDSGRNATFGNDVISGNDFLSGRWVRDTNATYLLRGEGVTTNSAGYFSFSSGSNVIGDPGDVFLRRDTDNTLALRNGTNAQQFNVYNTFTSFGSGTEIWERAAFQWSGNAFRITTSAGANGGSLRPIELQAATSRKFVFTASGSFELFASTTRESYQSWDAFTVRSDAYIGWASSTTVSQGQGDTNFVRTGVAIIGVRGTNTTTGGALSFIEQTAPAAPAANGVYIYAEDNGSGKTRLMALFNTGAAQQIAIEP